MSEPIRVRRCDDCGRSIPHDVEPVAVMQDGPYERDVFLCPDCEKRLRELLPSPPAQAEPRPQPKDRVEMKEVTPTGSQFLGESSLLQSMPVPRKTEAEPDPYWQGRTARAAGVSQADNPYDGRSKQGRNWQRGWYEGESSKK